MKTYIGNIEKDTLDNNYFRKVLFTGKHAQLVLMTLEPGEDIGLEVHHNVDQFFRFESGKGVIIIDDQKTEVQDGYAAIVPAGSKHNIINTSKSEKLKIYTLYSPSNHPDGTIHKNKAEAIEAEKHEHH